MKKEGNIDDRVDEDGLGESNIDLQDRRSTWISGGGAGAELVERLEEGSDDEGDEDEKPNAAYGVSVVKLKEDDVVDEVEGDNRCWAIELERGIEDSEKILREEKVWKKTQEAK